MIVYTDINIPSECRQQMMALHQTKLSWTVNTCTNTHTQADTSTRVTKPDNQLDHAVIV